MTIDTEVQVTPDGRKLAPIESTEAERPAHSHEWRAGLMEIAHEYEYGRVTSDFHGPTVVLRYRTAAAAESALKSLTDALELERQQEIDALRAAITPPRPCSVPGKGSVAHNLEKAIMAVEVNPPKDQPDDINYWYMIGHRDAKIDAAAAVIDALSASQRRTDMIAKAQAAGVKVWQPIKS